MLVDQLRSAFEEATSGRRLLDHPYYRRWQDGDLSVEDLSSYAEQYRHVERCLPEALTAVSALLDQGVARQLVNENLNDELSNPRPHLELFEAFAAAVGASQEADPTEATKNLVRRYQEAAARGPVAGMAVIGAYEVQAAQVAATKADALRGHFGLGDDGTAFWDVHADLERAHAAWTVEALSAVEASPDEVLEFATLSAAAWWAFLDEQEAASHHEVSC